MDNSILDMEWSCKNRDKDLQRLKSEKFDLVIIGGGITGAGIAREAALRGIKTAIVDKNDFGYGTSSRSSKLAHGGFRYLAKGEIKIVRESTTERNWLRTHFSHNVRPLKTNVCVYKNHGITKSKTKIGIFLYDFISNFLSKYKQFGKHSFFEPEEAIKNQPAIDPNGLEMMGQYYDNHIDDGRLTLETIKEAVFLGDIVALNYLEVLDYEYENDTIKGIFVKDDVNKEQFSIHATQVVNATGIWTDDLLKKYPNKLIRPTKGVHVVVPKDRVGNNDAFGLQSIDDGRYFFAMERDGLTVIGTTDTDYPMDEPGTVNRDLNLPYCTKADCDYLFNTVNTMFPQANLTYEDIVSTWAGIRPLVQEEGKDESAISRKHQIIDSFGGLTSICGGKLTTYRLMAEELIYHIISQKGGFGNPIPKQQLKKGFSKQEFKVNLSLNEWNQYLVENPQKMDMDILKILHQQYGKGVYSILKIVEDDPEKGQRFMANQPFIPAEIEYILEHEYCFHLIDILRRRTEIFMKVRHDQQPEIALNVGKIMAAYFNWSEERLQNEVNEYLAHIKKTIWF